MSNVYYTPTGSESHISAMNSSMMQGYFAQPLQQRPVQQQQQQQQQPPQQQQQPYPTIDFYYETHHFQQPTTTKVSSTASMQTVYHAQPVNKSYNDNNNDNMLLLTAKPMMEAKRAVDEDYVENLNNELIHTKQLLQQYQLRTEQLMGLVKKQTDKIKELRSQLAK